MIGLIIFLTVVASVQSKAVNITGKNQVCCGTCFQVGCPAGQCCSQFGYCGSTAEYCGTGQVGQGGQGNIAGNGNCGVYGCPAGSCCSRFGFCGTSAEHCGTGQVGQVGQGNIAGNGNCRVYGCPPGNCCSVHGFCGNTAAHCGYVNPGGVVGGGNNGQGTCQLTGCPAGNCCSRFGFCGNTAEHCAGKCIDQTCVYGQCINDRCKCNPGVTGELCNRDIIDCDSESCLNNGTCIELMNGFACQCLQNFDGPRCQYLRTINDNHCKKKCLNNGKCVVINNREKCLCSIEYYGSKCEHIHINDGLSFIRKCSLLKYRKNHNVEAKCLAIDLTPLFDVYCQCHQDQESKNIVNCLITPSPYSTQKCSFKTSMSPATLTTLYEPIIIHVCPVNWQILDQYENTQEMVYNVHITQCQLL